MQRDIREKEHGDTNGPLHPGPRIFDATYLINHIPNDWNTNDHFFTVRRGLDEGQYTDRLQRIFGVPAGKQHSFTILYRNPSDFAVQLAHETKRCLKQGRPLVPQNRHRFQDELTLKFSLFEASREKKASFFDNVGGA
tara:strand:+ start:93 stop:506 length:414 start_codon:yes stop_codon:yes gene_type:complete